jgi:hypothetical protein
MSEINADRPKLTPDQEYEIWEKRRTEYEGLLSDTYRFNDVLDRAVLIDRFFSAMKDRYSRFNDDPILMPILAIARERYGELQVHDFTYASRVANTEAIRAINALPDDVFQAKS